MSPSSNCGENTNENNVDNQSVGSGVPNIEKMGGKMLINKLAGEGVVKVVKQCEKAKETLTLGELSFGLLNKIKKIKLLDNCSIEGHIFL